MTEVSVGFIDEKTRDEYNKAKNEDPQLYEFLERATNDLKKNPTCGIKIPKNLWPCTSKFKCALKYPFWLKVTNVLNRKHFGSPFLK